MNEELILACHKETSNAHVIYETPSCQFEFDKLTDRTEPASKYFRNESKQ